MKAIGINRNGDNTVITIGSDRFTKSLSNEEFKEVCTLISDYNTNTPYEYKQLNLNRLYAIFNPYYYLMQEGFVQKNGQLYYKDLTLPLKGLFQQRVIEAFESNNQYHFESLINFHTKCCNNEFIDNIDKLYEHIVANNFTITHSGDLITKKKAVLQTTLDLSKFKGFYLLDKVVKSRFGKVSEIEANEFLNSMDCSKILASHSVNNRLKDKFFLTNINTNERTEYFDYCEYRLGYVTEVEKERCDYTGQSCAFSLHSTCSDNYTNTFSGNIVVTCLLNPEWITNIPTNEASIKLRSYKLQVIGIYDEECNAEYID